MLRRVRRDLVIGAIVDFNEENSRRQRLTLEDRRVSIRGPHLIPCRMLDSIFFEAAQLAGVWMCGARTGVVCSKWSFSHFCYCGPIVARTARSGTTIFSSVGHSTSLETTFTMMLEGRLIPIHLRIKIKKVPGKAGL